MTPWRGAWTPWGPLRALLERVCTFTCRVQATPIACPVFKPCCCFLSCTVLDMGPEPSTTANSARCQVQTLCPCGPAAATAEIHVVLHQDGGDLRAFLSINEKLRSWRALLAIRSPNLVQPSSVLLSMNQAEWHQLGTETATSGPRDLPPANHGILGVPSQASPFPGMSRAPLPRAQSPPELLAPTRTTS